MGQSLADNNVGDTFGWSKLELSKFVNFVRIIVIKVIALSS